MKDCLYIKALPLELAKQKQLVHRNLTLSSFFVKYANEKDISVLWITKFM